ncbi:DUF4397 domain-containing protein [Agaribacter flavus]|uniref:DUF4397 domain-containing protein n=1 Tax=Agaribacter flavus TaxID=1902781 RepID=A0ABV7FP23_9ALTE
MNKLKTTLLILGSTLLMSACNDDDDPVSPMPVPPAPPAPPAMTEVRVIHASPDAPAVNILANGAAVEALAGLDYQAASGLLSLDAGEYTFVVDALLPGDQTASVITVEAMLEGEKEYNVLAVGDTASIEALLVVNDNTDVTEGNVRAQVVHAAPDAPTVDVYVTAVDADIEAEQPLATLAFKDFTPQVEIAAGDYQIRITPAGTKTVVFDSGSVTLSAGADLLISATENVATGMSPVKLLVADGSSSSKIMDVNTPAEVRAIHGIADAPAVDVLALPFDAAGVLLFDGAPFKGVTDYLAVEATDYILTVVADADNNVVAIDDVNLSLEAGVRYTALANNTLANADLDTIIDDGRRVATAALVRIFHASQATPGVDIYVTADGEIDNVDPAFTNVEYSTDMLAETGYVSLAAGDYVVTVTPTGTKTKAIETGVLSLEVNKIYTAIAVDGDMAGDAPQLILADDFIN